MFAQFPGTPPLAFVALYKTPGEEPGNESLHVTNEVPSGITVEIHP